LHLTAEQFTVVCDSGLNISEHLVGFFVSIFAGTVPCLHGEFDTAAVVTVNYGNVMYSRKLS